jgi:hypothetical protein
MGEAEWMRQKEAALYTGHAVSTFRRDYTGRRVEKQAAKGGRIVPYYKREWLDAWMLSLSKQRRSA